MSVSSGSSLCGDADQDLLLDDEEEIDFYAVLNVPRDATEDEINKAYRKRCLIFHPDRHIDENDKRDAEKVFVNLRRAHETLTDQKKRAVYDALGIQGLDAQGWELVTRSSNPENIRKEYEFLQRLKEQELMLQRIHPSTGFVVKTSLVGLFQEAPEESPQLLGMSISQSVDCAMTGTDRVGIVGRVKTGNGRGDGNVTVMWKKTAGPLHFENNLTVSGDAVGASCRVSRNVFQRAAVIVQPQLQYSLVQQMFVPSLTLIYSMRLRLRWQGSLILSWSPLQSGVTTSIVHTENNQPKAVANFTLSPTNSNIRAVYYLRDIHSDAFTEMACQMSLFGLSPSIHFERRLSRFSRVGCTVNFSFPACLLSLKLKLKTGQSSFDWHILLCDDKETLSRSVILGLAVPYFSIKLFKLAFRPWCDRISALFDDHSHDREVDAAKQEESGRIINLMRPTAERIKKEEEQKHGIIVVEAKYGQCDSSGSRAYPLPGERTIDVTIPVQSMVNDSQLRIYAVKNQLPGFYDPCPGEPKMLYIKYLFRDAPHLVIVNDDMPLQIPMRGRMTEKSAPPPGFNIPNDGNSSTASAPPVSAAESTPSPPYPNMGSAYPGPPPSYQSAMTYPASAPVYPPNPMPNAAPYPAQPVYVPPSITVTQLPQPPPQQHSTQRVVYHVAQGPACSHCGTVMRRESDLCCIICLVLLTIFTFPFGLLFLCCLPCAVQMRCPGCGRSS